MSTESEKRKVPQLKNQSWMDEFSSYLGEGSDADDSADSSVSADQDENFKDLFEASQKEHEVREGEVIDGTILSIGPEYATVDIGYKCEGLVPLQEFKDPYGKLQVNVGDVVSVYLERMEMDNGFMLLSKDKAEIIRAWDEISEACQNNQLVEGTVIAKIKGGLTVDIGVKAFLPGSQIDTKPVKNLDRFVGKRLKFKIIKFNKKRGNIVLSRRAVVAEEREMQKAETRANLQEGAIVTGQVKAVMPYGVFIDLGGVDGLLHLSDMAWGKNKIKHPSEVCSVGDEIKVKILKFDRESEKVALGLKQLTAHPWEDAEFRYPVGINVKGKVVRKETFGVFVEFEDGLQGLIHVSELSWTERLKNASNTTVVNVGDEVECKVIGVDSAEQKIKLSLRQLQANPWDDLEIKFPVGTIAEGTVKSVTEFGVFVDVGLGIDGMVHSSDISWNKKNINPNEKYKKGDAIRAVVLSVDKAAQKFSLGVKQLERDPWESIKSRYRVGQAAEGVVTKLIDIGAFVEIEEGVEGLIYVAELADHRVEKPSDVLKVGDQVKAEILSIDPKGRKMSLSIKQLTKSEERANYETYVGERTKKTSMGDVLGEKLKAALGGKKEGEESSDSDSGSSEQN